MPKHAASNALLIGCAALLAGCAGDSEPAAEPEDDPALGAALNEPIMIDLDLVGQNRANSVAALAAEDGSLPTIDNNPEVIVEARTEALRLVGGPGNMRQAPDRLAAASSTEAPAMRPDCAARLEYTAQWAARLPAAFPAYPRAAVQEAAGTDANGCALRVIVFETPVPADEVIDFYFTRGRAAGFSARHSLRDGETMLTGAKGRASYEVHARRLPSGNSEVALVTSG